MFRAWLGSFIGEEIQQVKEFLEQGKFPAGLLLDAPRDGAELFLTNQLVGLTMQEKIDQICCNIVSNNTNSIGVQGAEGIGKTALMMEVYNRLSTRESYRVYYVNVPQNFTIYSLQSAIAAAMKVDLHKVGENVRAARLFNVLKSMKEYVVILDGLSECLRWEEVGILPAKCNATAGIPGKLVFTTQSLDVCGRMVCQTSCIVHVMKLLEVLSTQEVTPTCFRKPTWYQMCASIWSFPSHTVMNVSAYSIPFFCGNHHLLQDDSIYQRLFVEGSLYIPTFPNKT